MGEKDPQPERPWFGLSVRHVVPLCHFVSFLLFSSCIGSWSIKRPSKHEAWLISDAAFVVLERVFSRAGGRLLG